jgi:uncharacterized membrane protein
MKQNEFISKLQKKLEEYHVNDIDEIIEEYNAHYIFKLNDGYSEEEVSVHLGDPLKIAQEYITDTPKQKNTKKAPILIGLFTLDFFVYGFLFIFGLWVISFALLSIVSMVISFSLFTEINIYGWIPNMPYWCGAILGVSFAGFGILSLIGTYYSYEYLQQLNRAYIRSHKNTIAYVNNKPQLPSLPTHPILSKKLTRKLRSVFLISLNTFAISFVLGYVACAISAKSLEFWHVFGWFQ